MKRWWYIVIAGLAVASCGPTDDLQGLDPVSYYQKNPKINKLETKQASFWTVFHGNGLRLEEKEDLRHQLDAINSMAIEETILMLHPSQIKQQERIEALKRVIKSTGADGRIGVASSEKVKPNEARVDVRYAVVIPPHCPDWRLSPVTTYSNTHQGNFGCAHAYNLGRTVADPHDLVKGQPATSAPDPTYTSTTIQNYRSGGAAAAGGE